MYKIIGLNIFDFQTWTSIRFYTQKIKKVPIQKAKNSSHPTHISCLKYIAIVFFKTNEILKYKFVCSEYVDEMPNSLNYESGATLPYTG